MNTQHKCFRGMQNNKNIYLKTPLTRVLIFSAYYYKQKKCICIADGKHLAF